MEVAVGGRIEPARTSSRFVADDSLSISKMYSVGLVTISNPVKSSPQNNSTVLRIELETN